MSKAFTKEPESGSDVYDDLPDRPVSPHNLVTPKGLEMIEAELARLHAEHAAAHDADDRPLLAKINRISAIGRRAGPRPKWSNLEGRERGTLRLDGNDRARGRAEAHLSYRRRGRSGAVARHALYVSPVAQAMLGKQVGDVVEAGTAEATIVKIA